jgi:hypothetical protein
MVLTNDSKGNIMNKEQESALNAFMEGEERLKLFLHGHYPGKPQSGIPADVLVLAFKKHGWVYKGSQ